MLFVTYTTSKKLLDTGGGEEGYKKGDPHTPIYIYVSMYIDVYICMHTLDVTLIA